MTGLIFMILIGLNFVLYPCEGKISLPPRGDIFLVEPGTDVKIAWSFDDKIDDLTVRVWRFEFVAIAIIYQDEDVEILNTSLPVFEIEKPSTLVLKNVDVRYNGTYSFETVGKNRPDLSDVTVIVAVKPDVTVNCSNVLFAYEDNDLTCQCKGEGGQPPANVTWYKDDVQFGDTENEEKVLSFINIDKTASGTYKCVAQSYTLKNETSIEIIVYYAVPPRVTSLTSIPEKTMLGKTVVITCEAIAVPVPRYKIIHNDTVVVSTRKTYIITVLNYTHAGSYNCIANNILGNSSKIFSLAVIGTVQATTVAAAVPTANSSNKEECWSVVVWYVVVSLLSGFIVGVLLSCIVGYSRRRYRNKKNPARSNLEAQTSSKTDSIYQDLDLNKMNKEENYESLRVVNSDDPRDQNGSDYTELNLARDLEDNYQSLTST